MDVFQFAFEKGIPHASCEQYVAQNLNQSSGGCTAIDFCRDCTWPPCHVDQTTEECVKQGCEAKEWVPHYVESYFPVKGNEQMKAEIYQNGPISCGIEATPTFDEYQGFEVYGEKLDTP